MVRKRIFYRVLFSMFVILILHGVNGQSSKHNILSGIGLGFPYNQQGITKPGFNFYGAYLLMLTKKNGVLFQSDIIQFRNKSTLAENKFSTLSLGYRYLFTERNYVQFCGGYSSFEFIPSGISSSAAFEVKTGFLLKETGSGGYDISVALTQTTKKYGWLSIKAGGIVGFRKKIK